VAGGSKGRGGGGEISGRGGRISEAWDRPGRWNAHPK